MALVANNGGVPAYAHAPYEARRSSRYYAGPEEEPLQLPSPPFLYEEEQLELPSPPFLHEEAPLQNAWGMRRARTADGLGAQWERRSSVGEREGPLRLVTPRPRSRRWEELEREETLEEKLARAEREIRRMSQRGSLVIDHDDEEEEKEGTTEQAPSRAATPSQWPHPHQHPHHDQDDEKHDESDPEKRFLLSVSLSSSPLSITFPSAPIELSAGPDTELLLPPPRPRPHSHPPQRPGSRPTNKIASSRSRNLRANSVPPTLVYPREAVPGEELERDPLSIRFRDIEDDPRSPISPIGGVASSGEVKAALERMELGAMSRAGTPLPTASPAPAKRRSKARWGSLPETLIKFALAGRKKGSKAEEKDAVKKGKGKEKEAEELTQANLSRWEHAAGAVPHGYRSYVPDARRDVLTPPTSPALATAKRYSTASTLRTPYFYTPTPTPSQDSWPASPPYSPSLAHRSSTTSMLINRFPTVPGPAASSLAAQKEALLAPEWVACTVCGEVLHPAAFAGGRVCAECVRSVYGDEGSERIVLGRRGW